MSSLTQPGSQICSVAPQQLQEDKLASKSWNVQRLVRAVHGKNVQVCPASSLLGLFDLVSSGSAAEPSVPRPPPVNGANFKRHRPLKDRIALATCPLLCTGDAWVVRQRPLPLKDEIMPPNMPAGARNLSETLPSNIVAKLLKHLNYLAYWNITKAQHNQMAAVHPVPGPVLGVNFDFLRRGNVFKPVDTRPSNLNNHSQQNQIRSRPTTTSSASTLAVGKGYDLQAFYNRDKG